MGLVVASFRRNTAPTPKRCTVSVSSRPSSRLRAALGLILSSFADLHISNDDAFLSLVELEPGASAEKRHVTFFTKNLDKAHQWFAGRGVAVEPTATDSGGNRLFRLQDLEGNTIEVCVEPG